MALTKTQITNPRRGVDVFGLHKVWVGEITFDSSYATGGEELKKADFGFAQGTSFVFINPVTAGAAFSFGYDYANEKLVAYWGDNANAAAARFVEVAAATDLSAIKVRVMAMGV